MRVRRNPGLWQKVHILWEYWEMHCWKTNESLVLSESFIFELRTRFRQGYIVALATSKFSAEPSTLGVTFPLEVTLKYLRLKLYQYKKISTSGVLRQIYSFLIESTRKFRIRDTLSFSSVILWFICIWNDLRCFRRLRFSCFVLSCVLLFYLVRYLFWYIIWIVALIIIVFLFCFKWS